MTSTTAPDLYYDPYDYDVDVDAQAVWKRLRDEAPVYCNEQFDFYALSRYDDVLAAMLDTETYSSAHATTIELMAPGADDHPDDDLDGPARPHAAPQAGEPRVHAARDRRPRGPRRAACARRCWTRSSAARASTTSTSSARCCRRR